MYQVDEICKWIKNYFLKNGRNSKAIIGISGGKDSTICAALLVKALGKDRVIGIKMPNGDQEDIDIANKVINYLDIESKEYNIYQICQAYKNLFPEYNNNIGLYSNIPARVRMSILYAVAAEVGGRVCCTCNKSEDYVGYSTKFGDAAGDFALLKDFTVEEVIKIGETLKLPKEFIYKTPSDGLCGQTDEDRLGFTYAELDDYILRSIEPDFTKLVKIISLHEKSQHKEKPIQYYKKEQFYVSSALEIGSLSLKENKGI